MNHADAAAKIQRVKKLRNERTFQRSFDQGLIDNAAAGRLGRMEPRYTLVSYADFCFIYETIRENLMKRLLLLLSLAAFAATAPAETFPSKPVKIVVSYPPGGPVDLMARPLAAGLQDEWGGTTVIVENKPGANAIIGSDYVAKQHGDGYTLLFAN